MKIRYSTGFAVFILVAAVFVLGTSFLTGASINTFTSALLAAVGIGYLTRPLAELTDRELTILPLIGPMKRHYPIAGLRVVDGKIFSGEKRVRFPAWCTNSEDWGALTERLRGRPN